MPGEEQIIGAVVNSASNNKSGRTIGGAILDLGVNAASQAIQNEYNKAAEERSNAEWQRRFDLENEYNTPAAQAARLREAGVNPLSQLSGASPTPSASGSTNSPSTVDGMPPAQFAALAQQQQRVDNETKVANAQAHLLDVEAGKIESDEQIAWFDAQIRQNKEKRDAALHPLAIEKAAAEIADQKARTKYQEVMNEIAEATKSDKITESHLNLQDLYIALDTNRLILANLRKDGRIKDEIYNNTLLEGEVLRAEIFNREIANSLGVKNFERLTGRSYYNPSVKVGPGLWDIQDAKELNEKMLSDFEVDEYDTTLLIDRALKVAEIADIVNDDVFNWVNEEEKRKFEKDLTEFKSKSEKERRREGNYTHLLTVLLPFILKKFVL